MRVEYRVAVVSLLLCSLTAASADSELDTRLTCSGPVTNRLTVRFARGPLAGVSRIVTWTEWQGTTTSLPDLRLAIDGPEIAVGPLVVHGGLRELSHPHPSSATNTAWLELTGVAVDGGIRPARRAGFAAGTGSSPVLVSYFSEQGRQTVALSARHLRVPDPQGGAESGRSWIELAGAASRPDPDTEAPGEPESWFGLNPQPREAATLTLRSRRVSVNGGVEIDTGHAAGVSLSGLHPPGTWLRVSAQAAPSEEANGPRAIGIRCIGSLTSPAFLTRVCDQTNHGAAFAVALSSRRDASRAPVHLSAEGRMGLFWDWQPVVRIPGFGFNLRALFVQTIDCDLRVKIEGGGWACSVLVETGYNREEPPSPVTSSEPAHDTGFELELGRERAGAAVPDSGFTVETRVDSDEIAVSALCTAGWEADYRDGSLDLELGAHSGLTWDREAPGTRAWESGAELEANFKRRSLSLELEAARRSQAEPAWDLEGEVWITVRSSTNGE